MEYFKDKNTALKEIQTGKTTSTLGIPAREIRGTLNQIPKEQRYGLKGLDFDRTTSNLLSKDRSVRRKEQQDIISTAAREVNLSSLSPTIKTETESVEPPVTTSKPFGSFTFEDLLPIEEDLFPKFSPPTVSKLDANLDIGEPPEETSSFTDFGLGFKKLWNYVKAFKKSVFYSDEEDKKEIENIYDDASKVYEEISKTGGGKFAQKWSETFEQNEGIVNTTKKLASLVYNNKKDAINLVTQELPVLAVPLMLTPIGFGANMLLRGGLFLKSAFTIGSLYAGNKVIEQGAATVSAAEGGITDEELAKLRTDSSIKAGVLTGVDLLTFKLGSKFFTNNVVKDLDTEVYKVFKREGKDYNQINAEVKEATANAIKQGEADKSYNVVNGIQDNVAEVFRKNGVSNETIDKAQDAINNKLDYYSKSFVKRPKDVTNIIGNFGLQTLGEGGGEYLGSAAIGEADISEAALEGFIAAPISIAEIMYQNILNKGQRRAAKDKKPFDIPVTEEVAAEAQAQEEITPTEIQEGEEILTFDQAMVDDLLNQKDFDAYLAGHILNAKSEEEVSGEVLVDPLYRMIDAHDKKFPDANLRKRVDGLLADPNKNNELEAKTLIVEKTVTEKLADGDFKVGTRKENLNGFGIKSIVNTAQKLYPLEQKQETQGEPLQDQDTTPKVASQITKEEINKLEESIPDQTEQREPLSEKEFALINPDVIENQQGDAKLSRTYEIDRRFKENKFRKKGEKKPRIKQTFNQEETEKTTAILNDLKNSFVSRFNKEGEREGKTATINLSRVTKYQRLLIEKFDQFFDTDLVFITDYEYDKEKDEFVKDNLGIKVDGAANPIRFNGGRFKSSAGRNTIVVNTAEVLDSERSVDIILAHELGHTLEKTKFFEQLDLQGLTDRYYSTDTGKQKLEEFTADLTNQYRNLNFTEEQIQEKIKNEKFVKMLETVGSKKYFWNDVFSTIYEQNFKNNPKRESAFKEFVKEIMESIKKVYDDFKKVMNIGDRGQIYQAALNGFSMMAKNNIELKSIERDIANEYKTIMFEDADTNVESTDRRDELSDEDREELKDLRRQEFNLTKDLENLKKKEMNQVTDAAITQAERELRLVRQAKQPLEDIDRTQRLKGREEAIQGISKDKEISLEEELFRPLNLSERESRDTFTDNVSELFQKMDKLGISTSTADAKVDNTSLNKDLLTKIVNLIQLEKNIDKAIPTIDRLVNNVENVTKGYKLSLGNRIRTVLNARKKQLKEVKDFFDINEKNLNSVSTIVEKKLNEILGNDTIDIKERISGAKTIIKYYSRKSGKKFTQEEVENLMDATTSLLDKYDRSQVALVIDSELRSNKEELLSNILNKSKFESKLEAAEISENMFVDEKLYSDLINSSEQEKNNFLESILFNKDGSTAIKYGNFPPIKFNSVTFPFEFFLKDLVSRKVFTQQQINSWLRKQKPEYYHSLLEKYSKTKGIHTEYSLNEYVNLGDDKDYFIDNKRVLSDTWFASLYKAEQDNKVLGDFVVRNAIKTVGKVGDKYGYKDTSTYAMYKEWKNTRQKAIQRKIVLDDTVVNPADAFSNLLFMKYPLSLMKKIDKVGIKNIKLSDLNPAKGFPERPELNKLENNNAERVKFYRELTFLSREETNFTKRYFDDIAAALAYRPRLKNKTLQHISDSDKKEFSDYLKNKFNEKLSRKQRIALDKKLLLLTNNPDLIKDDIKALSKQNERELSLVTQYRLGEIADYFELQGFDRETAVDKAFEYVHADEKIDSTNEQESKTIVDRANNEDTLSIEQQRYVQGVMNDQFTNNVGVSIANQEEYTDIEDNKLDRYVYANNFRLKRGAVTSQLFNDYYVRSKVDLYLNKFNAKFNVNVVKDVFSLPNRLKEQVSNETTTPKGLYDNETGAVYLFSDNLESDADIEFTLFHELYGHYGLRSLFGKDFDSFLNSQYKVNSKLRKEVDKFIADNNLSKEDKLVAIEEILADEVALNNTGSFVSSVIAKMISYLDQIGLNRVAAYLRNISSKEVVFELARMKAREGNIEGPIGQRFDIRYSDPTGEERAEKEENKLTDKQLKEIEKAQEEIEVIRGKLYKDNLNLRKTPISADQQKLLDRELRLAQKIDRILGRPLSYRSRQTNKLLSRDTQKVRTVNKITAKKGNDTYTALHYHPTDSWYILKNDEFVQRVDGYDKAKDYMANIAGGLTNILERYSTPYMTNRGEYKIKDFFQYNTSGKKRGALGVFLREKYFRHINQFAPIMDIIDNVVKFDTDAEGKGIAKGLKNELFLNESKTGAVLERFKIDFVNPLVSLHKAAIKLGATPEIINKFLHAEHAVERNKQILKITQGRKEDGSGMTDFEATQELNKYGLANKKLLKLYGRPENKNVPVYTDTLIQMSTLLNDMSRKKVNLLYNSGIISFNVRQKLNNYTSYRNLSSVQRGEFKEQSPGDISIPGKYSVSGSGLQRAMGRESEGKVDDILINTILGTEQALIRAGKNQVSQKVLAFFEHYQDTDRVRINSAPTYKRKINESGFVEIVQEEEKRTDDKMYTRVNGVRYEMKFMDVNTDDFQKALYKSLAGQGQVDDNAAQKVLEVMRGMNRWIGSLVTTYNPAFVFVNAIRDAQTALSNTAADPRVGAKVAKKMARNYLLGVKAATLYLAERSKNDPRISSKLTQFIFGRYGADAGKQISNDPNINETIGEVFEKFRKSGAMTFYLDRINSETQMQDIRRTMGLTKDGGFKQATGAVTDTVFSAFSLVENFSAIFEIAPRFAAYYTLTQEKDANGSRKFSDRDAAVYAKELTTNFNMRGSESIFRDLYIFFNPAVQGTRRLIQNWNSKQFAFIAGLWASFGMIANMLARADDDDDELLSRYDMLPEYKKNTSIVFGLDHFGSAIPIAYGWNISANLGRLMYDVFFEGLSPKDFVAKMAIVTAESTSPMAIGLESQNKGIGLAKTATPTALLPVVEFMTNENRFGSPISRSDVPFLAEKSDAYKGFTSTNPFIDELAKTLNEATGGSEYESGAIDFNPAFAEHFLNSYIPGLATNTFRMLGRNVRINRGEEGLRKIGPADLILDRFKAYPSPGWFYGAVNRLKDEVNPKYNRIMKEQFDSEEEYNAYRDKNINDIELGFMLQKIDVELKSLKSARNKTKTANVKDPNTGLPMWITINNHIRKIEEETYRQLFRAAFKMDEFNNNVRFKNIIYDKEEF